MIQRLKYWAKPHVSWLIASFSIGVLVGAIIVFIYNILWVSEFSWLATAFALGFLSWRVRNGIAIFFALVAGIFIGSYVTSNYLIQQSAYTDYYDKLVVVTGTVADDTLKDPSGNYRLKVNQVRIDNQDLPGDIWVSLASPLVIKRGDFIKIEGILKEGFGTLSGSLFRAQLKDISRPVPGDIARVARDSFSDRVSAHMPSEQAQLGVAYVTGQKQSLSEELKIDFRILGLIHVVVASGFHLTIIVGFSRRLFAKYSRYLALLFSSMLIWGFLMITGYSATMVRATIVSLLSLIAWYYGRIVHPVVLLLIVAALTIIINPSYIWGDVGWYLSFAAFTGVIIMAPLLNAYFWGDAKEIPAFRRIIIATISAQITTFPIIAIVFGQYSPLALLSNLLILPLVPLAMALTTVSGIAGFLIPYLGDILSFPAYVVLKYMTSITNWLSVTPFAYGEISITPIGVAISYVIIVLIIYFLWRKTGYSFSRIDALG
jgi:competence protein ComEC